MKSRLKWENGFTIIEILIATGLAAILTVSTLAILKTTRTTSSNLNSMQALHEIKYFIVANIKNEVAFNRTVAANPAMACLNATSAPFCAGQGRTQITLVDANGAPLAGVSTRGNASQGIRADGEPCSTFSATGTSANCPFRFEVEWEPRCPATGNCAHAENFFNIKLLYAPGAGNLRKVNTSTFNFTIARSDLKSDRQSALIEACNAAGGNTIGSGASLSCSLPYRNIVCTPPQVVIGFNADMSPICGSLNGGVRWRCPPGGVLLGIDNTGRAVCGNGCDPTGAGSGMISIY